VENHLQFLMIALKYYYHSLKNISLYKCNNYHVYREENNMFFVFFICHYRYVYCAQASKTTVFKYNAMISFLKFFARCICQNRCFLVLTHFPPVKAIYCQNKRFFFGLFGCVRLPVMSYCQYNI